MLKEKLNFGKNQAFFNRSSTKLGYESDYILPEPKEKENFIGWLNTGDNKIYQPNEKVKVVHGLHFLAQYKES